MPILLFQERNPIKGNLQAGGEYEDKDEDFEDIRRSPYNDKDTEDIEDILKCLKDIICSYLLMFMWCAHGCLIFIMESMDLIRLLEVCSWLYDVYEKAAGVIDIGTDISKITRKQSKTGKHGHENGRVYKSRKPKSTHSQRKSKSSQP
ncbi:hypothetical protein Tco_1034459 [Tanacetum coccineum]